MSRRYISADHAVQRYFDLIAKIEGCPGLDPTRMLDRVDSQAAPENPHLEAYNEKWALDDVFAEAFTKAGAMPCRRWWKAKRTEDEDSLTKAETNAETMVDALIEEELARRHMLVYNAT